MECRDFELHLDDWLDGRLEPVVEKSVQEHVKACTGCRSLRGHALAVKAALRKLEPPAPTPIFLDQALSRAARAGSVGAPRAHRAAFGLALAASLVLAVAVGVFFTARPAPVETVSLTLERPETVRLMFNSAMPLRAATLDVALPQNVELVGYDGRRELVWQTDLREGKNLLQLPLVARGAVKDELVARLSHDGNTKTFRLKIEVADSRRPGL